MKAKIFEVMDNEKLFTVLAVRMVPDCKSECDILTKTGYGEYPGGNVLTCIIDERYGEFGCDTENHKDKTMQLVHKYIKKNYKELETGCMIVVDNQEEIDTINRT